jgi:hypothetical protein
MSRTTVIAIRYSSLAIALGLSAIYLKLVLPMDQNVMDLKASVIFFIGTYLLMTSGLLVFNRLRKFDIASICWAALSGVVICQLGAYKLGLAPTPHLAELISGVMGILASLLPVCVANIRGESRGDHYVTKYLRVRHMVTAASEFKQN